MWDDDGYEAVMILWHSIPYLFERLDNIPYMAQDAELGGVLDMLVSRE